MSIPFFKAVLKALGKRLNYEAVVNYAGNSFCKDAGKLISESNPLRSERENVANGLLGLFSSVAITPTSQMKDMEWAMD